MKGMTKSKFRRKFTTMMAAEVDPKRGLNEF